MPAVSYLVCLWPGLPRLWRRGDWSALAIACGFAAALNAVLVASWIWPEWWPAPVVKVAWPALALAWAAAVWREAHWWQSACRQAQAPKKEDLLLRAQTEYLKGHWPEAEALLKKQLKSQPGDVDSRLMLAALFRRTKQIVEARRELEKLKRTDGAEKWTLEIYREQRLLTQTKDENQDASAKERSALEPA